MHARNIAGSIRRLRTDEIVGLLIAEFTFNMGLGHAHCVGAEDGQMNLSIIMSEEVLLLSLRPRFADAVFEGFKGVELWRTPPRVIGG